MKYAQKVAKKESIGGLPYPLNYMVHSRLLPVYLEDKASSKSYLASNFQDQFFHIQSFSQSFLGVKNAFQILHLMKHVFSTNLVLPTSEQQLSFANFDEDQNKALYTLKTLMQKLTKEFGGVLRQKLISIELISDKKIQEPIDYFSLQN